MAKRGTMFKYTVQVDGRGFNVPDEAYVIAARVGGRTIGELLRGEVAPYPPATAANKPGRVTTYTTKTGREGHRKLGWYQRGVGWHYPSGTLARGKTSQRLGARWQVIETAEYKGSTVLITNSASYAQYVHGKKQAKFHAKRGWKQIFKVMASRKRKEWIEAANQKVLQLLRGWR